MKMTKIIAVGAFLSLGFSIQAYGAEVCEGYGPQTPRDISSKAGSNAGTLTRAPSSEDMNLCNIHFHTQAEHKGPGFSVSAGGGEFGGFKCNETPSLTKAELEDPTQGHGACHGVKPGDTVEMHWVYTSCDVMPGEGLGSCLSDKCLNPQLRVETQVFLVVNDPNAADFASFTYDGNIVNALHQSKSLPTGTGKPIIFQGSTTGPQFTEKKCSPLQATWSVRPSCKKIDVASLNKWCEGNVFNEDRARGIRQLVTSPELLSTIP